MQAKENKISTFRLFEERSSPGDDGSKQAEIIGWLYVNRDV
jgi:hypothetical protein